MIFVINFTANIGTILTKKSVSPIKVLLKYIFIVIKVLLNHTFIIKTGKFPVYHSIQQLLEIDLKLLMSESRKLSTKNGILLTGKLFDSQLKIIFPGKRLLNCGGCRRILRHGNME